MRRTAVSLLRLPKTKQDTNGKDRRRGRRNLWARHVAAARPGRTRSHGARARRSGRCRAPRAPRGTHGRAKASRNSVSRTISCRGCARCSKPSFPTCKSLCARRAPRSSICSLALPPFWTDKSPRPIDDKLWTLTARRPTGEWVLRDAAAARARVALRSGVGGGRARRGRIDERRRAARHWREDERRRNVARGSRGRRDRPRVEELPMARALGAVPPHEEMRRLRIHVLHAILPRQPPATTLTARARALRYRLAAYAAGRQRDLVRHDVHGVRRQGAEPLREADVVIASCGRSRCTRTGSTASRSRSSCDERHRRSLSALRRRRPARRDRLRRGRRRKRVHEPFRRTRSHRRLPACRAAARRAAGDGRTIRSRSWRVSTSSPRRGYAVDPRADHPGIERALRRCARSSPAELRRRRPTSLPIGIGALFACMSADPDLFRAGLEYVGTLTPVQEILRRPDVQTKMAAAMQTFRSAGPPPSLPGPNRGQLLALIG